MKEGLANLVAKALYDAWEIGVAHQSATTPEDVHIRCEDFLKLVKEVREAVLTYDGNTGGYK